MLTSNLFLVLLFSHSTNSLSSITNNNMAAKNKPWGDAEKSHWLSKQIGQRSYYDDVLMKLPSCVKDGFKQVLYGSLSYDSKKYPLYAVVPENWDSVKKTVLVTGGVHGQSTLPNSV